MRGSNGCMPASCITKTTQHASLGFPPSDLVCLNALLASSAPFRLLLCRSALHLLLAFNWRATYCATVLGSTTSLFTATQDVVKVSLVGKDVLMVGCGHGLVCVR